MTGPGRSAVEIIDARAFGALNAEERRCRRRPGARMIYLMYLVVGLAVAGLLYLLIRDLRDRRRVAVKRRKDR